MPLPGRQFPQRFRILSHFQMAENIFQHHDGIIDQPGKCQGQSAQHHGVDVHPRRKWP